MPIFAHAHQRDVDPKRRVDRLGVIGGLLDRAAAKNIGSELRAGVERRRERRAEPGLRSMRRPSGGT